MSSQPPSLVVIPSVLSDDGSSVGSDTPLNRSDPDRWYFPKERLENTPSRRNGVDADKELTYRQQSANFIQDIGQRLQVNQLCINTAIVYMHRFYMFHSFTNFHRNSISAASIFLAAKVEEQPRKLEHVIKVAHYCLHRDHQPQMDSKSEQYLEQSAELVMNENILLQTLGFDVAIDHPHTHVVKCCQLVRASKDLAQTSYFMATNSLHLTTMCLQYKPTVVACVCIHLACKWSSWEIPRSKEGKDWFWYVDDTVTTELLEKLTTDFLQIFNKSPSRLKKKIISLNNAASTASLSLTNVPYHGFDSSPGHHHGRSRSPSPKRPGSQKPNSSQPGVPGKMKPHGVPMPHHPMKHPYPPGAPGSGSNKHSSHLTVPPPHGHPGSHSSSSKPPHPGMPHGSMKDPNHPHHSQHSKNAYPPHGHGQHAAHGQYPHGNRQGIQSSGSSQSHHGHSMHSKPPIPGPTSSSHPYSSSSMKNMPPHNPSKPSHLPPAGAKMPPNQVSSAVKNPSQPGFHSSQQHMKKQYEPRQEYNMKREGQPPGVHHSQNHGRVHDKLADGKHGMPPSHGSTQGESRTAPHHNMPYLSQDIERSSGSSASNQKLPYMDSRSMDATSDMNRHRSLQPADAKRGLQHGSSAATNGNKSDFGSMSAAGGSGSGGGDSHNVPSKNAYRPQPSSGSTFGQNSQNDMGANKFHSDMFGGAYGSSYGSSANILSIEDRRKRRHAEAMANSSAASAPATKRPRSDNYASTSLPPLSANSLFSPEELDSSKRLPPPTSQFSPSAIEGNQTNYSKVSSDNRSQASGNSYGGGSSEGISFGSSSDTKPDIRRLNPSVEFQTPELLQPISDVRVKTEVPSAGGTGTMPPRATSLFSPEFTPSNPVLPNVSRSPADTKRDAFWSMKQENVEVSLNQQSTSGHGEGGSQSSFTGRHSNSPKRDDGVDGDDSHSSKKSKKKKDKHKHKHKDDKEKKHKKDKHKEKEKEKDKDKKDKHRSKEKHSSSLPAPQVSNEIPSHKIKIKLGRDDSKSSTVHPSARHSSSKASNSTQPSMNAAKNQAAPAPLPALKVKISSKGRVSSVDDDSRYDSSAKHGSPGDESTPCCPGFGPCLTCNRETTQDQYRFFSTAPAQGLTMKFAKSKETSKSTSKESSSSSSRESKKFKEKTSKPNAGSGSTSSLHNPSQGMVPQGRLPYTSGNHVHKNGMEKSSKKKDKSGLM